jgi:5-methylcytosine-specific restriction endonuclease McrA
MGIDQLPDWRDESTGGSMVRAAIWLSSVIGEGNTFTKQQLRDAFPGIEQIDRRMRDLRPYGWVINDNKQDESLKPAELKLVKVGARVWIAEERASNQVSTISARVRTEAFVRDNHQCTRCGIAAGEPFDDNPAVTARLTAAHIYPGMHSEGEVSVDEIVTTCQVCNEPLRQHTANYLNGDQVWEKIKDLGVSDKQKLRQWIELGRRPQSQLDRLWAQYRQLPGVEREDLLSRLRGLFE